MTRYQRGDLTAFAALVQRHKTPMFNFVLRQLKVPATAEDVVQEVFVRVIESAGSFKHEAKFTTWVVYHRAKPLHRSSAKGEPPPSRLARPTRNRARRRWPRTGRTAGRSASARLDRTNRPDNQIQIKVGGGVEALPDEQREVFLLRHVANLPFQEIAQVTGAPENTVKSRMRYALERLQEALTDFEEYARALR